MNGLRNSLIFLVLCGSILASSLIMAADELHSVPSQELLDMLARGNYASDSECQSVVKDIYKEGHTVRSCITYLCHQRKKAALEELLNSVRLSKEVFYDQLNTYEQKTHVLFEKESTKQERADFAVTIKNQYFDDKKYKNFIQKVQSLRDLLLPRLPLNLIIENGSGHESSFFDINIMRGSIKVGGNFLEKPVVEQHFILLHEFLHILKKHLLDDWSMMECAKNDPDIIAYSECKNYDLYRKYCRAREVEADLCSLFFHNVDQSVHGANIFFNKQIKMETGNHSNIHPKAKHRLKWTNIIDRLLKAETHFLADQSDQKV